MMGCKLHYHMFHTSRSLIERVVDGPDKGIIPQTCSELFARVTEKCDADEHLKFTVEVSYIEVRLTIKHSKMSQSYPSLADIQ